MSGLIKKVDVEEFVNTSTNARKPDDADIEIPYPHMQLLLEKSDGVSELAVGIR